MAEITLIAEPGRTTGSSESRRMRSAGRVPAVVYGHGIDGISVSVEGRDLRHALSGEAGLNQLLSLKVGSDTHLALARSLQRHPVRHTVLHVDFQIVRRDEVISAEVPIVLIGESKSVEQEKGIVEHLLTSLTVNATPASIPSNIEVDISEMTLGESIRVGDLPLPSGVTTDVAPDDLVVMASATRAVAEEEAGEGDGEGVEGEGVATESGGAEGAGSDSARADGASGSEEG
jgi:large subunit ribosomal protein L25